MPRLTLELIQRSRQDLNPAKDRQLTLRGNKIEAIENLGATQDYFSCIDLSDNSIMKLNSIPKLPRLRTLMLANNLIKRIDPDIASGLTHLESLVLTKNKLEKLCDLAPLGQIKTLQRLSLVDNPLTKQAEYRLYIIYTCRNTGLRILDFRRILDSERNLAGSLFSGPEGEKHLLKIAPKRVSTEEASKEKVNALDKVAVERIKQAIMRADTMQEVSRLEKALKIGHYTAESLEELLQPQILMDIEHDTDEKVVAKKKPEAANKGEKKNGKESDRAKSDKGETAKSNGKGKSDEEKPDEGEEKNDEDDVEMEK